MSGKARRMVFSASPIRVASCSSEAGMEPGPSHRSLISCGVAHAMTRPLSGSLSLSLDCFGLSRTCWAVLARRVCVPTVDVQLSGVLVMGVGHSVTLLADQLIPRGRLADLRH